MFSGERRDALVRLLKRCDRRLDLPRLERAARAVERLQALAGDVGDDALRRVYIPSLRELGEHRDRDAAGGLGEDPGGPREQLDSLTDLVVGHRVDRAAGPSRELERVRTI